MSATAETSFSQGAARLGDGPETGGSATDSRVRSPGYFIQRGPLTPAAPKAPRENPTVGGRPSKFTARALKTVLRLAKRGLPLTLISQAVGVTPQGLRNYRRDHERFEAALQKQIALGVDVHLKRIEKASQGADWRASGWLLEHCWPEHFSKSRVEVSGLDGSPLAGVVAVMLPPKQDGGAAFEANEPVEVPALTEGRPDGSD